MSDDYEFTRAAENMVAEFRGLPKKNKRGRIRKAKEIGGLMENLIERFEITTPRPETEIMYQWSYIMGEHNAERCQPIRVQGGVLQIGCANPTLSRELHMNKRIILRRVQGVCPSIRDVRFLMA